MLSRYQSCVHHCYENKQVKGDDENDGDCGDNGDDSGGKAWYLPTVDYHCTICWTLLSFFYTVQQIHDIIVVSRNSVFWPISELHMSDYMFGNCSFLNTFSEKSVRLLKIAYKLIS